MLEFFRGVKRSPDKVDVLSAGAFKNKTYRTDMREIDTKKVALSNAVFLSKLLNIRNIDPVHIPGCIRQF